MPGMFMSCTAACENLSAAYMRGVHMMDDIKILCVTHRDFDDSILPAGYQVVKVGKRISDETALSRGWLCDHPGDNIADENPWYSELPAHYWGWKNLPPSVRYVGLCHYRRYFFDYHKESTAYQEDILTTERMKQILQKYRVILSIPTVKLPGKAVLYKNRPDEQQDPHWVIVRDIIYRDYPEYRESFDRALAGRYTVWGNLLVTSREIFDEYSAWLFGLLKKYDAVIADRGETRKARVDAALAEHLLLIWMEHRFSEHEIFRMEVRNTETDSFVDYSGTPVGNLVHFIRCRRKLLLAARRLRMCVLLVRRRDKNR